MLDFWDEIESDLSVFHRVDDWRTLSGPRLLRLARLLGCYGGAVQTRLASERAEQGQGPTPVAAAAGVEEVRPLSDVGELVAVTNQNGFSGFEYAG